MHLVDLHMHEEDPASVVYFERDRARPDLFLVRASALRSGHVYELICEGALACSRHLCRFDVYGKWPDLRQVAYQMMGSDQLEDSRRRFAAMDVNGNGSIDVQVARSSLCCFVPFSRRHVSGSV